MGPSSIVLIDSRKGRRQMVAIHLRKFKHTPIIIVPHLNERWGDLCRVVSSSPTIVSLSGER